ncbi:kinase [Paramuricea clavata]|uniref:Kinase n=1 Tax=Paramuricea clavata TaxID=317549 RepID=A0A7D9LK88_PARCT|nr:kinase [Paramuricea clavata]
MNKRINEKVETIKNRHDEMKQEQHEVKKEIKDVKENLSKVNKDVDEVKVMMSQMLEKFNMLELLSKHPSPTQGMFNTPREDILIAAGWLRDAKHSAEIFSWAKNGWYEISQMNERHGGASSFIYNDQLFVVGGLTKTIETLNLNELPLKWMEFSGRLLDESYDCQIVVYQQRVIHIGGHNCVDDIKTSVISELQLTSRCRLKRLCQMPQPRVCHGAEAFEDKVLILGGKDNNGDVLDNVLEFDPKKNECKELPSLPHPIQRMATVRWRDQVVVLGGRDKDGEVLNDVFMYDCKTGKITALPSMLETRYNCCAVITGNTIVIMGGWNNDVWLSRSVECFTMGGSTWKYLPSMNDKRCGAVAELLPSTRKCVYV